MRVVSSGEGEELAQWLCGTAKRLGCGVLVTDALDFCEGAPGLPRPRGQERL